MKKFLPLAAAMLLAAPAAAQDISTAEALGTWGGTLSTPGGDLRLVFVLDDEDGDGTIEGKGYSPDQTAQAIALGGVALDSNVLTVTIPAVGAAYEGTWNGEAFVGTFSQGGGELPLTLTASDWMPGAAVPAASGDN